MFDQPNRRPTRSINPTSNVTTSSINTGIDTDTILRTVWCHDDEQLQPKTNKVCRHKSENHRRADLAHSPTTLLEPQRSRSSKHNIKQHAIKIMAAYHINDERSLCFTCKCLRSCIRINVGRPGPSITTRSCICIHWCWCWWCKATTKNVCQLWIPCTHAHLAFVQFESFLIMNSGANVVHHWFCCECNACAICEWRQRETMSQSLTVVHILSFWLKLQSLYWKLPFCEPISPPDFSAHTTHTIIKRRWRWRWASHCVEWNDAQLS